MKRLLLLILPILFFVLVPVATQAAVMYLEPEESVFGPGDSFGVDIKLDVDTGCINTIEGFINFSTNYLNVIEFVTGSSFLSLWIEQPSHEDLTQINSTGELHFAGGIPGGYCGRIPGDPGLSNVVGQIIFKVPGIIVSDEQAEFIDITINNKSRVLLNDGLGTIDNLKTRNARYRFATEGVVPGEGWREFILSDNIPPEPFIVELHQDSRLFEGNYYIIFNTVDKQTGVDHYEILELRPDEEVGIKPESGFLERLLNRDREAPDWQTGAMPYLLKDQTLKSIIKVRAIDKAGNERLVEYVPPYEGQKEEPLINPIIIVVVIVILLFIIISLVWLIMFKRKKKKELINTLNNSDDQGENQGESSHE
jgi:hypothetical protein